MASEIFSGASRYASDFQSVITRAVSIASLPLTQLRAQQSQAQAQTSALQSLTEKLSGLQSALTSLSSAVNSSPFTASVANTGVLTATVGAGALPGSYTVKVISPGSRSVSVSSAGLNKVTDPDTQSLSSDSTYTLNVGGATRTITPATNTLSAIAQAINGDNDSGVTATIVNLGSSAAPDYRLSLESKKLGPNTLSFSGSGEYLTSVSTGDLASYQLNGVNTTITSDTNSAAIAPGLTVQIASAGTATVVVSRNLDAIRNGLSNFATSYNRLVDELDQHRGSGKGLLAGHSLISQVNNGLRKAMFFASGNTDLPDLTRLGVSLDKSGHVSLDNSQFDAISGSKLASFFGSTENGGFLHFANEIVKSFADPVNGTLAQTVAESQKATTRQQSLIDDGEGRVDKLRESLQAQFASADALIASLEQRVLYVEGLFGSILKSDN